MLQRIRDGDEQEQLQLQHDERRWVPCWWRSSGHMCPQCPLPACAARCLALTLVPLLCPLCRFPTSCRQAVKAGADYPGAITLLSRAKAWQRRRHLVELYRRAFCAADVTSDDDDIRDAALATQAAAAAALGGAGTHAVDKDSVALETARAARAAALSVDAPPVDAPPEAYGIHPVASAATAAAAVAGPVRPVSRVPRLMPASGTDDRTDRFVIFM